MYIEFNDNQNTIFNICDISVVIPYNNKSICIFLDNKISITLYYETKFEYDTDLAYIKSKIESTKITLSKKVENIEKPINEE